MTVHRISEPSIVARSEVSQFHDLIQLSKKAAPKESRFARVSTEGSRLGSPSLYLGGNSAIRQPWSYAPVRHDVVADVETQNKPVQDDPGPVGQDGWERAISDAQQRQAELKGWERAISDEQERHAEAELDSALDNALAEFEAAYGPGFEAALEEFNQEWAAGHHGVSVDEDGTLHFPADHYNGLALYAAELQASARQHAEQVAAYEAAIAAAELEAAFEEAREAAAEEVLEEAMCNLSASPSHDCTE